MQNEKVVGPNNPIWTITGKKYNSLNTLYKLPKGWVISGSRIASRLGWHRIPAVTNLFLY
jgi:hypothetical protein